METHNIPGVLILGANGRFGRAATDAFRNAGWRVYAQSRSPLPYPAQGVMSLTGDALDSNTLLEAVAGKIDVLVNGLNPPYTEWEQRVPALAAAALHIARSTKALLMLPGNIYNYGTKLPPVLNEMTPQLADTPKGKVRVALEEEMRKAALQGVRSVVIRAGDFLGGTGPGTWMDMVIAKDLGKRSVVYPGPLELEHAWAYLPDLAKVFVAVAERRDRLASFEVFHYEGFTTTGTVLTGALMHAAGQPLKVRKMPWWLLQLAAPFSPMLRAVLEMRYLWERPHRLSEEKLVALIGAAPHTDVYDVMRILLGANTTIDMSSSAYRSASQ